MRSFVIASGHGHDAVGTRRGCWDGENIAVILQGEHANNEQLGVGSVTILQVDGWMGDGDWLAWVICGMHNELKNGTPRPHPSHLHRRQRNNIANQINLIPLIIPIKTSCQVFLIFSILSLLLILPKTPLPTPTPLWPPCLIASTLFNFISKIRYNLLLKVKSFVDHWSIRMIGLSMRIEMITRSGNLHTKNIYHFNHHFFHGSQQPWFHFLESTWLFPDAVG